MTVSDAREGGDATMPEWELNIARQRPTGTVPAQERLVDRRSGRDSTTHGRMIR